MNQSLATALFVVTVTVGCGDSDQYSEALPRFPTHTRSSRTNERPNLAFSWPDTNAAAADRLTWNLRTLVTAYDVAGTRSPAWDEPARAALTAFAELRAKQDPSAFARVRNGATRALDAGCTDPMIGYLALRHRHGSPASADAQAARAYHDAAEALTQSHYPPMRKFYGALRAAQAWKAADAGTNAVPAYGPWRRGAFQALCEALQESDLPANEAFEAIAELVSEISANATLKDACLPTLIGCLRHRWPSNDWALLLLGQAQIALAWNRRGTGYAQSVPEEGWRAFETHLEGAARDLEESWRLNPTNPETAVQMLEVELGQGQGRDRMERWFNRAMKLDPQCRKAAYTKAWYLQPKWHGTAGEAIAFGRECVASTVWKGQVPLVLWEAHKMAANDAATGLKDEYWPQPGVWEDVRASFERFFELNPEAQGWRHDYAMHAFKCRQYDRFLDLLPTMGWVRDSYFGGRAAFDQMVAQAEKATGRKAQLPEKRQAAAPAH